MTERIILCLFLFLFTRTKQASSLRLLVHFVFIEAILLLTTTPSYVQIRERMDESSLGIERFPHEEKPNKTSMSWLTFITVLFANFAEGSARITFNLNWAFACENSITKSIIKCLLRLFVSTLHCSRTPAFTTVLFASVLAAKAPRGKISKMTKWQK